ncbi:hypothetical protein [Streptomyces sp. NPDC059080]|uniref:hypothetical protein n=1 Tax=Streptomyces sp. NPDC059080 TaxID=3346718 RepID=UPI00368127EA
MRHPVRRSLAVAAATVGLVAFGATAAQADSDWVPSERTDLGVFHAVTAAADGDTGRVICDQNGDCWTDRIDPTVPSIPGRRG